MLLNLICLHFTNNYFCNFTIVLPMVQLSIIKTINIYGRLMCTVSMLQSLIKIAQSSLCEMENRQIQEKLVSNPITSNVLEHVLYFGVTTGVTNEALAFSSSVPRTEWPRCLGGGMTSRGGFPVGNVIAFGNNYRGRDHVQTASLNNQETQRGLS